MSDPHFGQTGGDYPDIDPNHPHTVNHDEQQAEQTDKCVICGGPRHSHAKRRSMTDIEHIKELLKVPKYGHSVCYCSNCKWEAEFAYLCRNVIGPLLDAAERLEEAKELLREAHQVIDDATYPTTWKSTLHPSRPHMALCASIETFLNRPAGKETK